METRPDNTVIIHRSKTYTEQEVIEMLTDWGVFLGKKKSDSESYLRTYRDLMKNEVTTWLKETGNF